MSERLCATCRHAGDVPEGLRKMAEDLRRAYGEVHYCTKEGALKTYTPGMPGAVFTCGDYEPRQGA
jgi:hypothetical protein